MSNNGGGSWGPSLAIAPDDTPYVAWYDNAVDNSEIYVRRWNGLTWEEVGAGSASGGGISNNSDHSFRPTLNVAPNGTLYVAWEDFSSGGWRIYVRRWTGSTWAEVGSGSASGGGISNNTPGSWNPSLAIAPDSVPYVAWTG